MQELPIQLSYETVLVSDEDYDEFYYYKWYKSKWGYVFRTYTKNNIQYGEYLHVLILERMGFTNIIRVDHKDRNTLNCQRENLRPANGSQNVMNSKIRSDNKSGYRGVSWNTQKNRWSAIIYKEGKRHHLGFYHTAEEAAKEYNKAAQKLFKEFAVLNQVPE